MVGAHKRGCIFNDVEFRQGLPKRLLAARWNLISRAAATRAAVISVRDYLGNIDSERDIHMEEGLYEVPAVDAVPVVRCRDCKYSYENAKHIDMVCERSNDPDFYCAAGERMDGERRDDE